MIRYSQALPAVASAVATLQTGTNGSKVASSPSGGGGGGKTAGAARRQQMQQQHDAPLVCVLQGATQVDVVAALRCPSALITRTIGE